MVGWNAGLLNRRTVLDISGVNSWKAIRRRPGGLSIGTLATHTQIQRHAVVRKTFPLLAQACSLIGAAAIQNRGTLGGNIANASPAGDTFPPLAVYSAVVHVLSAKGRRSIPLCDIFAGVKKIRQKN